MDGHNAVDFEAVDNHLHMAYKMTYITWSEPSMENLPPSVDPETSAPAVHFENSFNQGPEEIPAARVTRLVARYGPRLRSGMMSYKITSLPGTGSIHCSTSLPGRSSSLLYYIPSQYCLWVFGFPW
jgi:hypothetical protein